MSATPARVTERTEHTAVTAAQTPSESRVDRRAWQRHARRTEQHWALLACAILIGAFGLTVGILDVLR
jgi:hypothetical protein